MKYLSVYDPSNKHDREWAENMNKDDFVQIGLVVFPDNLQPHMMFRHKMTFEVYLFPMVTALDEAEK